MHRQIAYYGAIPSALDPLMIGQNAMVGIAKLAEATLGAGGVADGFSLVPTATPSMTLTLSPGQVYQQANLEASAISLLNQDSHTVVKQGFALDPISLTFTAPVGVGNAVNVLVQVQYTDSDTGTKVLNYYNAANPTAPFSGPGNNGTSQVTQRQGIPQIGTKYGVVAPAGSQVTPAPDPGYIGLFVVTIAYGQTQIAAGNITSYLSANTVPDKLPNIPAGVQQNRYTYVKDVGTINAMLVTPKPAILSLVEGTELLVLPAYSNTSTTPTLNVSGNTSLVVRRDGSPVAVGDIKAGARVRVIYDGAYWRLSGLALSDLVPGSTALSQAQAAGSPFNFKNISSTVRLNASASTAGQQITVISGLGYTKKSPTSNLVIVANFTSYSPVVPGQGNGASAVRLLASNGSYVDVGLNNAFNMTNGAPGGSGSNSPTFVLSGIPAGAMTFGMSYARGDNYAWNTIFNPYASDFGTTGPTPSSFFFIYEYEPTS